MPPEVVSLMTRMERLERSVRRARAVAAAAAIGLLATWVAAAAAPGTSSTQNTVRTRLLVVEDSQRRERIVLGAPMPDGREYVGMKILNPDGAEQFGLGLKTDGSVSMGFDTRPGVGHPGNRERLNMGVTPTGQGWIRYLDNQTRARMFLMLDSTGAASVQFMEWPDTQRILVRQLGFSRDTVVEWER